MSDESWKIFGYTAALVQIMAWDQIGNKPLFELMIVQFSDAYGSGHGCVTVLLPGFAIKW